LMQANRRSLVDCALSHQGAILQAEM